jgi:hypothetical protein
MVFRTEFVRPAESLGKAIHIDGDSKVNVEIPWFNGINSRNRQRDHNESRGHRFRRCARPGGSLTSNADVQMCKTSLICSPGMSTPSKMSYMSKADSQQIERVSAENELDCAREIVSRLSEWTGLTSIVQIAPVVIVGGGNWISFRIDQPVSMNDVLGLHQRDGKPAFVRDLLKGSTSVRSRTSPSLHLTNCGTNENLVGHVDSYYYLHNPLGHLYEFFRKKTVSPVELLRRIHSSPMV